uniref:Uncharacterized protein n=1 Tax=Timema shepardi TaxID=629360 RepID=A0A7R9G2W9_TIMSH|nr:unnamed protein product [Timema shepardi]
MAICKKGQINRVIPDLVAAWSKALLPHKTGLPMTRRLRRKICFPPRPIWANACHVKLASTRSTRILSPLVPAHGITPWIPRRYRTSNIDCPRCVVLGKGEGGGCRRYDLTQQRRYFGSSKDISVSTSKPASLAAWSNALLFLAAMSGIKSGTLDSVCRSSSVGRSEHVPCLDLRSTKRDLAQIPLSFPGLLRYTVVMSPVNKVGAAGLKARHMLDQSLKGSCHSNRGTLPDFLTVTEYACIVVTCKLPLCGNHAPSLPTTQTFNMWQLCSPTYPPRKLPLCGNYAPQPTHHANSRYVAAMLTSLPTTRILKKFKPQYNSLSHPTTLP